MKKLLRPDDVEELYNINVNHQAKLRCEGRGPEFIKIGSLIYYEEASIDRWLDGLRRAATAGLRRAGATTRGEAAPSKAA